MDTVATPTPGTNRLLFLVIGFAIVVLSAGCFTGCGTPQPLPKPNLPKGSHAYAEGDYNQADGVSGKVGIDIPLDGYAK